jgi:transposase/DNA-binding CsgD family transcriptional regulator
MAQTTTARDLVLTPDERTALERLARGGRTRADLARRARIILRLAEGASYLAIQRGLGESSRTIGKWKRRFLADRVAGLHGRYPGAVATVLTPALEARILAWTRKPPTDGSTHWSSRKLARALKLSSHTLVARAWQRAGLQPHRLERYMRSTDPDFETKAADVIGLYVQPPQHAAVFCLDEKTAIQALDRLDPVLPLSPGRAERHGFEYYRHGTLSLYAALDVHTGTVLGDTVPRHTSDDFIRFLDRLIATQPRRREIHIVLDNLATHKTQKVRTFLAIHPQVHLHFTPTYSSWLNQVELWFAKIERDLLARGIFTSLPDLKRKILRYIRKYNDTATPIRWSYTDPSRRIA